MALGNDTGLHIHDRTIPKNHADFIYLRVIERLLQIKMVMGSKDTSQNRTINVNFSAHLTHSPSVHP